jgi:hypothetical protein
MAFLCARINTNIIRLVGCWRSIEMLRYLHLQVYPLMDTFARCTALTGDFTLLPGQDTSWTLSPTHDL